MKYTHNKFQKAAFWFWGIGAAALLIPIAVGALCGLFASEEHGAGFVVFVGCEILGIVLLATGGTLHKIGSSREIK